MAAVKIIPKQMLINSRMSLRDLSAKQDKLTLGIEREIVIMKLIEHPNLLGLWDVYETSKELFLVMEYVAGGELFDFLVARGRLPADEARMYFRQIIFGVDYCHTFSICHRDLKPENLLLDGTRTTVKIADFGMAALQTTEKMLETSCGSPHYASPEIVSGRSYDGTASDIWSCGIILFALLCGRLPFDDPNIQMLLGKVRSGKFAMPNHLEPSVRDLISRMLQTDPQKRATMREICSHPWFTDNGRLSSENPVSREVSALSNEPVNLADIDPDILGNLSTLWPELSHERIIRRLLEPGPNWQKTFYSLLVIHRDTYGTDDEDEDLEELDEDDNLALEKKREEEQKHATSPPVPTQLLPGTLATGQVNTKPASPKALPPIVPAAMGSAMINNSLGLVMDARKTSGSAARDLPTDRQPGPVSASVVDPARATSASASASPPTMHSPGAIKTQPNSSAVVSMVEQAPAPAPPTPPKDRSVSSGQGKTAAAWLMEQTKVEQIRAERMRAEVAKVEQALSDQKKQEQLKAEQTKAEQARAEQARVEQAKAEQARVEQAKAEQARVEQAKAEQARIEQAKAEQARIEQAKAEQARIEQAKAEQARVEQAKAEQARIEQAKAEQAKAEQAKAEQARIEQAKAEQAKAEQAKAEQVRIEQAKAEQAKVEQMKAEKARAEQARAEQARIEQAKAEQAKVEQAKAEQMKAEHPQATQHQAEQAKSGRR
ncbi:unnamed protein product [Malassezia sympodialis ATCC 42132]|uniref:uncharacterized protein n=1 Tax=Malassezia sympodialis (strain ATCC 42132) TaxID=1230383 RepID=UPI0002C25DAD|nr:uncharacterized protein MSY001_1467 [Malassezia sympodialis ATCC 42132]CCU98761.1 unnamed protein product [Malassezia sympodialis ATCC 42132]|eukprot:XP_018740046.1 uncharacterized protein MSY001_1467 [Malassezia sympodialis ATCC 42132]